MKTILVVDDEERIRRVYERMFVKEGFAVFEAGSVDAANEIMLRNKIDLVLLDINMPDVDGAVLYAIIQAFHNRSKVIVSSVFSLDDQKKLIKAATDYYDKSESIKVLLHKVRAALKDDLKEKKVLIIDDEPRIRSLFRRQLRMSGYNTIESGSGQSALRLLNHNSDVDLAVLDILLPEQDGSYVFETIKKQFPSVKIIISSVYPKDEQEFLIFDADDYYCKTESVQVLVDKVSSLLQG